MINKLKIKIFSLLKYIMPMKKSGKKMRKNKFKAKRKFRKRRSSAPAGDRLVRTFKYPGVISQQNGIGDGTGPAYKVVVATHSLADAGASDASVFLKYYQFYRIQKVYLKIKCLNERTVPVDTAPASYGVAAVQDRCTVHMLPWRDGVKLPTSMTQSMMFKLRQQKGSKSFNLPWTQLKRGFTVSYTPNTLDIGFETQGVITYNNYRPQYGKWLANNDGATIHYGYLIIIEQYAPSPIQLGIQQSITVGYKYKINDPLISIEATTTSNSRDNLVVTDDDHYTDHDSIGDPRGVSNVYSALANDASVYIDRDEGLEPPEA